MLLDTTSYAPSLNVPPCDPILVTGVVTALTPVPAARRLASTHKTAPATGGVGVCGYLTMTMPYPPLPPSDEPLLLPPALPPSPVLADALEPLALYDLNAPFPPAAYTVAVFE